jgi:hypothetical protein
MSTHIHGYTPPWEVSLVDVWRSRAQPERDMAMDNPSYRAMKTGGMGIRLGKGPPEILIKGSGNNVDWVG